MLISSNPFDCMNTSMDFRKLIYENVKEKTFISQQTSIYTDHHRHFEVLLSFILYILQGVFLSLKTSHCAYIPPYMHKAPTTLGNDRQNNSKLNFTKNVGQFDFLVGDLKSQNVNSPDWASSQKVRLHHCVNYYYYCYYHYGYY